ncbi:MAG TPA: hypothetical protein P5511_09765, partial [Candidatus Goldiibacteriota bacterium]|nr:hypothetical protein [Candidatus Goldiibacteriota bacterium]
ASTSLPSGVTTGLSTNFAVNPSAASKLLVVGPGQFIEPGVDGGNGRVGGSLSTTSQQAGSYFYVTVYAVDAYWNTVTSASGTVTISSSDTQASFTPASSGFTSGKAYFRVTMGTVGNQTLTVSHSGAYAANSVTVPVTSGSIDHFTFTQTITDKTAGATFLFYAEARDAFNNLVTGFNDSVTLEAIKGGTTPLATSHWFRSSTPVFVNGVLNGTVAVRIYERLSSCNLRLTYNTATGNSNTFVVNPAAFNKLIILAPGETYDPGAGNPEDSGKTGAPVPINAGSNATFAVYATDRYNNMITSVSDVFSITSSDSLGAANGVTLPVQVQLAGGIGTFNFVFMTSGTQSVTCTDVTNTAINPGTVSVPVQAGTLYNFTVS